MRFVPLEQVESDKPTGYKFVPLQDEPKTPQEQSFMDRVGEAMNFARDFALNGYKSEQKQEGSVLDRVQPSNPAYSEQDLVAQSRRSIAQGEHLPRRDNVATEAKGKLIETRDDGVLSRAADLAGAGLDSYSAGLGRLIADAAKSVGADDFSQTMRNKSENLVDRADRTQKSVGLNASNDWEKYAPQILSQFPQMAVAAASLGLPAYFIQSAVSKYGELRAAGNSEDQSLMLALPYGAAETLGEKLGGTGKLMGAMERLATHGAADGLAGFGRAATAAAAKEVPAEEFTYAAQFGLDQLPDQGSNRGAGVNDFIEGAKDTAIVAAGSGGVIGGAGKVAQMYADRSPEAQIARAIQGGVDGTSFAQQGTNLEAVIAMSANKQDAVRRIEAGYKLSESQSVDEATQAFSEATSATPRPAPSIPDGSDLTAASAGIVSGDLGETAPNPVADAAPAMGDIAGQPEPTAPSLNYETRPDGTVKVFGDPEQIKAQFPGEQIITQKDGVLFGRSRAAEVLTAINPESIGVYPNQTAANVTANSVEKVEGSRPEVKSMDDGTFAILPPETKEPVNELKRQTKAIAGLAKATGTNLERATREGMLNGVSDPDGRIGKAWDSFDYIARAANTAFGWKPIAVTGFDGYGATYKGQSFVSVDQLLNHSKNPAPLMAVSTTGHELTHVMERSADPQDKADYTKLQSVVVKWQKDSALKKRTAEEVAANPQEPEAENAARGQAEVVADASGAMWLDHKFWGMVYDIDNGSTMRRVAYKFMQAATRFLKAARGTRQDILTSIKAEGIEEVRRVAAEVWASRAMRNDKKAVPVSKAKSELFDTPPQYARTEDGRGVIGEVAPHPGDESGNAEMQDRASLTKHWNSMSEQEKRSATRTIGNKVLDQAQYITGQKGWSIDFSSGTFEGQQNPNFVLQAPDGATDTDIDEMTRIVGYMLDQKAMVSFDESNTTGDNLASFVKIELPAGITSDTITELRQHLRDHGFDGDTLRDGGLYFGNFTGYTDSPVSDADFHAGIDGALAKYGKEIHFDTVLKRFESGYMEPANREGYLEGTHYGNGNKTGTETGGDILRRRQGRDTLERVSQEIAAQRKRWTDQSPAARADAAAAARRARELVARTGAEVDYGRATEGSVVAVGHHFSQQRRASLSSSYYGLGLKGAEGDRLSDKSASDIRNRIYFYVDKGNGVTPEAGVGGAEHTVRLNNLYDANADTLGIWKNAKGDTPALRLNAQERAVIAAGFDGYLADTGANQDFAVLVGKHDIPMDRAPQYSRIDDAGASAEDFDRLNSLGSFDIDADYASDLDGLEVKEKDLSEEDMAKIEAELFGSIAPNSEVHPVSKRPTTVDYAKTDAKAIKQSGLFAEKAYPDIQYGETKEIDYGMFGNEGHVMVGGKTYKIRLTPDGHSRTQHFPMSAYDELAQDLQYGKAFSDLKLTPYQAREWNKRNMAAIDLYSRRHDLYTSVPADARKRILDTWKSIADAPGAFSFNKEIDSTGSNTIEKIQSVADSLLKGSKYKASIQKMGHGWVDIELRDDKGNVGTGQMEYVSTRSGSYFTLHAQHFNQGSSMGKPFYQIAQAAADALNVPIKSDAQGLLGVNNYRRTEQQMSSAARTGKTMTEPGSGQRIYGWNYKPKNQEQHDRNFVRLALAGARNVAEFYPEIQDLRYDLSTDKFTTKTGESAETDVKLALAKRDLREMSMSRSTLARAAITFEAMDHEVNVPDAIDEPVLYARQDGPKEFDYEKNYLVPEIDGAFNDGSGAIATLPAIVFARDGIKRTYPSMQVRIQVGEHQTGKAFNEQYGVQHRVDNQKEDGNYRYYTTPEIGDDSAAEVERAARDIALGVLSAKTVYADNAATKVYLHSPEEGRMTLLTKEKDSEGSPFWSVKTSIPKTREQMMRQYKAPTTINGIVIGRDGTQQSIGNLTGILNKLKEPGSFLASPESYILDEDGKLFKEPEPVNVSVPVEKKKPRVIARDANGKIILNKNKANPDVQLARFEVAGDTGRQYTPEQLKSFDRVGFRTENPTWLEAQKQRAERFLASYKQGIFDQFQPIEEISKEAYNLMRLSKGASGAFETLLHGGTLKLTDQVYDFDADNRGGVVDRLLVPLNGEHHDFMRWVAANRAERLIALGKENLFKREDIAAIKSLADGETDFDYTLKHGPRQGETTRNRLDIYKDSLIEFNKFNKNVMDLAEESGLIDPEGRKVWEHEFYVPFYRVTAEEGFSGAKLKSGVVKQKAFQTLKGGKDKLNADLLDNTLMNWAHLLDASAKNRAARAALDAAEDMGVAIEAPESAVLKQMAKAMDISKRNVVYCLDEGVERYYLVEDRAVLDALTAVQYAGMNNPLMNALSTAKHWLTVGVTASPFFKVRNLIRDSLQAISVSNLSYNPMKNVVNGYKLTNREGDAHWRLMAGGGTIHFATMLEGSEGKRVQALVESGVPADSILDSPHKFKAFFKHFIEPTITAYNEIGNRGEEINRAALYDQLIKQGMSHQEASIQARDLMDFSMGGTWTGIRFLAQVVPFFNARLQGMYKLGSGAKENPARFSIVLMATAMASLALLAAYKDDEDWKEREEWDRNNFWWFKVGGKAFRIPKPFEIGAIATLAERGAELWFDKEMTQRRFYEQVKTLVVDNLSMTIVPQLFKPIQDLRENRDGFSGRPIENMAMEKLDPSRRFTSETSMTARGASTAMEAVVGNHALSPVQIDHLIRGYFGWLGSFTVGAGDVIARPATNQPEKPTPDYWKVATGGMVADKDSGSSRYVTQVYDQAKELEQAYATFKDIQKRNPSEAADYAKSNAEKLSKYKRVENVKQTEGKIGERIRIIERSNMSAEQKRDLIRQLQEQRNQVAKSLR